MPVQSDDEYETAKMQWTDKMQSTAGTGISSIPISPIGPGGYAGYGTISGGLTPQPTNPGFKFPPPSPMVTDMPYFVLWYDMLTCIYVGTWCADDEAAIAEAQKIQNDKTKTCGQVLILERDQQWIKTWERR
jgi:hypothetical protein